MRWVISSFVLTNADPLEEHREADLAVSALLDIELSGALRRCLALGCSTQPMRELTRWHCLCSSNPCASSETLVAIGHPHA